VHKIRITGGQVLRGDITISGAKNAALPLLAASLLTDQKVVFDNVPGLADIKTLTSLLRHFGAEVYHSPYDSGVGGRMEITTREILSETAPYELVSKMRASFLVLGPLVARLGHAKLSLPGGCAIGARPVDLHLKGLEAMGAVVTMDDGYVIVNAPDGLIGGEFTFPIVSVTGTENLMMAACLAKGTTRLINAAKEPEVVDLGHLLQKMGASIDGLGTSEIIIRGVTSLKGASHYVLPDRVETGTYIMATVMTAGSVELRNTSVDLLPSVIPILQDMGVNITQSGDNIIVDASLRHIKPINIVTCPYPGFPTDLQAQMMAMLTLANGESVITEAIFENRFMHVPELCRLGAQISIKGSNAHIFGPCQLKGAQVMATDLRASVSLVMAALVADGVTTVHRVYHLDRGYESIEHKLGACGALIERIDDDNNLVDIIKSSVEQDNGGSHLKLVVG
jgi:UDP-N-acetylglucosamine 1-carboxyvinyltransferase